MLNNPRALAAAMSLTALNLGLLAGAMSGDVYTSAIAAVASTIAALSLGSMLGWWFVDRRKARVRPAADTWIEVVWESDALTVFQIAHPVSSTVRVGDTLRIMWTADDANRGCTARVVGFLGADAIVEPDWDTVAKFSGDNVRYLRQRGDVS